MLYWIGGLYNIVVIGIACYGVYGLVCLAEWVIG
jgi:hypothetical protein